MADFDNFYPRSPCGERLLHAGILRRWSQYFYPRSPCGERPRQCRQLPFFPHFYPRSPCGERRAQTAPSCPLVGISIHALLAESDSKSAQNSGALLRI